MPNDSERTPVHRANLLLGDLRRAVTRLADALAQPENEFVRDAAIQRFEFSFELAWKSIQSVARLEGQDSASPRMAFSTAWRNGWLDDEAAWLEMLDDRNKTSHTYRDAMAKEVFEHLPGHVPRLNHLVEILARLASNPRAWPKLQGRLASSYYSCPAPPGGRLTKKLDSNGEHSWLSRLLVARVAAIESSDASKG